MIKLIAILVGISLMLLGTVLAVVIAYWLVCKIFDFLDRY